MIVPDLLTPEARADRFARICNAAMLERRQQGTDGIGTLAEKWQHQIIKRYLSEDPGDHEIRLAGTRFVSDVRVGNDAYEVQTGAFYPMKKKIAYYMEQTDLTVTVVHPIAQNRWISMIDPKTTEISPRKKSPKHGHAEELLPELYCLLPYLGNPRLKFRVLMVETEDFRLKNCRNGRKAARFESIPIALLDDFTLEKSSDFNRFLPDDLPPAFTAKIFSAHTRFRGQDTYSALRVLTALGLLSQTDPIGRAMAWRR